MFREALEVARVGDQAAMPGRSRARWSASPTCCRDRGDEEEALAVGLEALAVGEEANQAFTAAVAHETVAASLRRLLRLDEALEHAEPAIRTFRELGARWELASALGDRGAIHRMAGRFEDAEADLREAFVLCRDLQERALVTWTAAELRSHPGDARRHVERSASDPVGRTHRAWPMANPARRPRMLMAECGAGAGRGRSRDGAGQEPTPRSRPNRARGASPTRAPGRSGGWAASSGPTRRAVTEALRAGTDAPGGPPLAAGAARSPTSPLTLAADRATEVPSPLPR